MYFIVYMPSRSKSPPSKSPRPTINSVASRNQHGAATKIQQAFWAKQFWAKHNQAQIKKLLNLVNQWGESQKVYKDRLNFMSTQHDKIYQRRTVSAMIKFLEEFLDEEGSRSRPRLGIRVA